MERGEHAEQTPDRKPQAAPRSRAARRIDVFETSMEREKTRSGRVASSAGPCHPVQHRSDTQTSPDQYESARDHRRWRGYRGRPGLRADRVLDESALPSAIKTLAPPGWLLWQLEKIESSPMLPPHLRQHVFHGAIAIGCDDRVDQPQPHATETPADAAINNYGRRKPTVRKAWVQA